MSATTTEKTRFRRKLDGNATSLPDDYIDAVFDEAEEDYAGYDRAVIVKHALVLGVDDLIVKASKLTDYDQNQSSEKRSQIVKALRELRKSFVADREQAIIDTEQQTGVRFGKMKRKPTRQKGYPAS